jgi:hypothetical protein
MKRDTVCHLGLVPRLRMSGAIHHLPLYASMACKVTTELCLQTRRPLTDLDNIQTDAKVGTQYRFGHTLVMHKRCKSHSSTGFHLEDTFNSTYLFCSHLHQSYYSWNQASSMSVASHAIGFLMIFGTLLAIKIGLSQGKSTLGQPHPSLHITTFLYKTTLNTYINTAKRDYLLQCTHFPSMYGI